MKRHIPNAITCCNLFCGCVAIVLADNYYFPIAFLFVLLGACFDFFDGMVARAFGVSGPMGVELDSLADVVTFGVAPSMMVFRFFSELRDVASTNAAPMVFLPYLAFLIAVFSALRLAKFNIDTRQHTHFIGLPTPANAILWSAAIASGEKFMFYHGMNAWILIGLILSSCFLLVCEVPMFALKFKNMRWADNKIKFVFLGLSALIIIVVGILGVTHHHFGRFVARGLASCIALYIVMSVCSALFAPKASAKA